MMTNKFDETMDQWMAHDDWQYADKKAAWRHFFLAGVAAATPNPDTIPVPREELNTIHELLFLINTDDDGDFFLCQEAEDTLIEVNEILNRLI